LEWRSSGLLETVQERKAVKSPSLLVVCCLVLGSTMLMRASTVKVSSLMFGPDAPTDARLQAADCGGEPCDAVQRGRLAFFDRTLEGLGANGRACADCHMPADHFQLSPDSVEARFQFLQRRRQSQPDADDPLFRPIDADDFRTNGDAAADFRNLRENGLVRITFALPPNIRLIDPATNAASNETFVDVWRMVPSVNNVALTGPDASIPVWPRGPNPTGGYQLDARVATLQEQALGALTSHAQIQNPPPQRLLDDLASFQRLLFTNHRVRALSDAIREGTTPLPDPDPPLSELEEQGKAVFARACGQCHGGPGMSTPQFPVNRFINISSGCPRPVDTVTPARFVFAACEPRVLRNARTYEIELSVPTLTPGGFLPAGAKMRRRTDDPGRAFLTGFVGGPGPEDDWEKFDVPGLRGISATAPYFHNNSAATLDDVVDHYTQFFKRVLTITPQGVVSPVVSTDGVHVDRPPRPEERAALLAYLRRL
jgi:cytochrome c peroxidase